MLLVLVFAAGAAAAAAFDVVVDLLLLLLRLLRCFFVASLLGRGKHQVPSEILLHPNKSLRILPVLC